MLSSDTGEPFGRKKIKSSEKQGKSGSFNSLLLFMLKGKSKEQVSAQSIKRAGFSTKHQEDISATQRIH